MKTIFKNLWEYKIMVLGIIFLLVIQAFCDLSLPQYTSDIVDIGIQQSGIEYAVMEEMSADTYQGMASMLLVYGGQEEQELFAGSYRQTEAGSYVLKDKSRTVMEQLDGLMVSFMQKMYQGLGVGAQGAESGDNPAGTAGGRAAEGWNEALMRQQLIQAVKSEYQGLGWDMGRYQMNYLLKTGTKMLGITLVMMAAAILAGLLASYAAAGVGRNLRSRIFKKVISFSQGEMDQFSTASLITRSTNDVQQIQMVSVMLLRMVLYAPILGIGGVAKVLTTRTGMGWVIALAVGTISVLVVAVMAVAMPKFKKMQKLVDRLNLVSREILTGIPVIRAFSREKHEEGRFAEANRNLMKTQLFTNRVMAIMMPAMMLIMNGITVLIVWVGAHGIELGSLQVGDMMAFITYTMQIVMSFLMITMISVMLPRAGVAANRIQEVLDVDPKIQDPRRAEDEKLSDCRGVLEFQDVCFRYPGADEDALEHISFTAQPGKTTAIIGSTGCGKSTLLHLIPRFYDVTTGSITLDGIDIRRLSQKKLREQLGFVPQKAVLFSGNIASNVKFAGEGISDERMQEAAQIAQAMEFISQKEDGFLDAIAQGGTNVSGGQKQRLSIARAIAKHPRIFLFDDSFSALDYKTDALLRQELHRRLSDAAILIVAQRISTILHADQILVLEEGRIVGMGTHRQLLESCETYQEIAKSQLSEAELSGSSREHMDSEDGGADHE